MFRDARMVHWWKRSPPTTVAWVRSIPKPGVTRRLRLGWDVLFLVPAPRIFLRVFLFSSLHKNQHSKFQFDPRFWSSRHVKMGITSIKVVLWSLSIKRHSAGAFAVHSRVLSQTENMTGAALQLLPLGSEKKFTPTKRILVSLRSIEALFKIPDLAPVTVDPRGLSKWLCFRPLHAQLVSFTDSKKLSRDGEFHYRPSMGFYSR